MSDFNTNLTDRAPPRLAPDIVEIFLESDFPAPASGIIPLAADTTYRICGSISTANQLAFPVGSDCEIQGGFLGAELIYTGSDQLIITDTFASGAIYRVNGMRISLTENNADAFAIASEDTGTVLLKDNVLIFAGDNSGLGNFNNVVLDLENIFMFNPSEPSVFFGASAVMELVTVLAPSASDMGGDALFSFTGTGTSVSCRGISTSLVDDDHIFNFDATMTGPIVIDDCADSDPANVEMFNTAADITVVSFSDDGGEARVSTGAVPHGYVTGDRVLIKNSVNYHGGYEITVINTTTFDLDGSTWVDDDTILNVTACTNGSLDFTDSRVQVINSGGYQPSRTIGSVIASSNSTATTINTAGVFEELDLGGLAGQGTQNERFLLNNADLGSMIYIGQEPIHCHVTCDMTANIGTGSDACAMQLQLNDGDLPTGDDVAWEQAIQTAQQQQWHGTWLVELNPDDVLHVEITNLDTTEDITVEQYTLTCN